MESHELVMMALLNNLTMLHDKDNVSVSDRVQPVGYNHSGLATLLHHVFNRFLNDMFGFSIKGTGWLEKHKQI
jgi:hypothetical protein